MVSRQGIRGAVLALCLVIACAQQMSYNKEQKVQAENELFCNDVNMTMFFNKTALDERFHSDGTNNRPYRIYYDGHRNIKGCYMDKSFDRNIVPQSDYDKKYEGVDMTLFNNTWCSKEFENGFYMEHKRCISFIRTFNESWCEESFMDGMFVNHTWCQYNFSQINYTWCEKDYQNGAFRDHPRCQDYAKLDFKNFNATIWCSEDFYDNLLGGTGLHPFCFTYFRSTNITASWCKKDYQYKDFKVGVFYDHPRCHFLRSYKLEEFKETWCNENFEGGLFKDHHFCQVNFADVNSTWCNKSYRDGEFMEHPKCHTWLNFDPTTFKESMCNTSYFDGLFMDHVFCRYNNSNINASFCSNHFEEGMFLKHPFCIRLYNDYDFYNFDYKIICSSGSEDKTFIEHALCTSKFFLYNITEFNKTWCSSKYENGIFLEHPFCQQLFVRTNFDNFEYLWCSMDYEDGIYLEHPKCKDVKANQTTFYRVQNEARFDDSVFLASPYDRCGINVYSDDDFITFNQTIVIVYGDDSPNDNNLIQREEKDYYHFMCKRNRTIVEKLFGGGYFNTTFRQEGRREDNATRAFELSLSHANMEDQRQDIYQLGDYIKFRLKSHTSYENVKAVVQQCWTTSDGYNDKKYMLIDNRCTHDQNTFWMSQNRSMSEFKVEAFRYLGAVRNSIYMECHVRMCTMDDKSSQCDFCDDKENARNRRSADEEESKENLQTVKSPVFYIIERPQAPVPVQENSSAFTGTNGTIVIILLSAMVFIGFVLIIKKFFFTPTTLQNKAMLLERA